MKKWAFVLCCVLSLGFILVGCGDGGTGLNANDELYFNGPSAVVVGDYLYFGNGMNESLTSVDSFESDDNYNSAKALAYLARLNVNAEKFSAKGIDYSPNGVSNIGSEVAAYTNSSGINSFMFAIGNYIFYATPNNWETANGQFNFGWTTIYKSKRDGSDKKEIYSTRDLSATVTKIEVLKFNGNYYLMMLAGTNLVKLNLTGGGSQVLRGVTSVAMPKTYQKTRLGSTTEWNGVLYYTKDSEHSDVNYNEVYSVSISDINKNAKKIEALTGIGDGKLTFLDREVGYVENKLVDDVFFTLDGSTYKFNIREKTVPDTQDDGSETTENRLFYDVTKFVSNTSISDSQIYRVVSQYVLPGQTEEGQDDQKQLSNLGYVYATSTELHYVLNANDDRAVNFVDEAGDPISYSKVVSIDGTWVVLLGESNIYRAEISSILRGGQNKVTAKMVTTMEGGIFADRQMSAYDGDYVYYYAKLNPVEPDENDDPDGNKTGNDDTNYYFCRSSLAEALYGDENYQVLGLTQTGYRHS